MTTTFYVGEQPIAPFIVTVEDRDLTGLTVEVAGDTLPENVITVPDPTNGRVQITFTAPFTDAGVLVDQLKLTDGSGGEDLTDTFEVTVLDPADATVAMVTPVFVEAMTGTSVSTVDVARAQGTVSIIVARDLSDADFLASISDQDTFWLRTAISYQSAKLATDTATATVSPPIVPGASSVSNGDVSISYRDTTTQSAVTLIDLDPLARVALQRVTWMQPMKSIQAKPFLSERCRPDPWQLMYRTSM